MNRRSFFRQAALFVAGCAFSVKASAQAFEIAEKLPEIVPASIGWGSTRVTFKLINGRWYKQTEIGRWKKMSAREQRERFESQAAWRHIVQPGNQYLQGRHVWLMKL